MIDRNTLVKLRDRYRNKADDYYWGYQYDGLKSQYNSYRRNNDMADALDMAVNAEETHRKYIHLTGAILAIDVGDERAMKRQIVDLKDLVSEGVL